jgi:hypothetical protein
VKYYTKESVEALLVEHQEKAEEYDRQFSIDDNLYYRNYEQRSVETCERILEFIDLGCTVTNCNQGLVINDKFIVTGSGKWRIQGKNVWYTYSSPEQFFNKFVKKG